MNDSNPSRPAPRRRISPRRIALVGSVAGVALAVLVGGSGGFRQVPVPAWSGQAQATETTLQHSADFADLIAKVKPAVVSVRVKIDQGVQSSSSDDNASPPQPGSPAEKFFRQFGGDQPQQRRAAPGQGSGFFI